MKKLFCLVLAFFVCSTSLVVAVETENSPPHFTFFINQVRGSECCDQGKLEHFKKQLSTFDELGIKAHFALRYDALSDKQYLLLSEQYPGQQYGLLLEITPGLAQAAQVNYQGNDNNWYQASHSMLVGYSLDERKKLIDTVFSKFHEALGAYPTFTTSWLIDPWSLKYIKSQYGVISHQITREQFGTDSYTLYGGPMHYPYYPSNNWALIPESSNKSMPIIVRQTITDPVYNYGDRTNSYTSQPNDYKLRAADFSYFEFLFKQAHQQPNSYTFALLGLENSMADEYQSEYQRQIEHVAAWANNEQNSVIAVEDLVEILDSYSTNPVIYQGTDQLSPDTSKAWWIRTDTYRVRLRLSNNELFISDLRVYDPQFTDPYLNNPAEGAGWWIVPFYLDGSRYHSGVGSGLQTYNDFVTSRKPQQGSPQRLQLYSGTSTNIRLERSGEAVVLLVDDTQLAAFKPGSIELKDTQINTSVFAYPGNNSADESWSIERSGDEYTFSIQETDLDILRSSYKSYLFPEVSFGIVDPQASSLYVNNRYAVAGRNPARLVFFPKNKASNPTRLDRLPTVSVDNQKAQVTIYDADEANGMVFIDIESNSPLTTRVTVQSGNNFETTQRVVLAPNCKSLRLSCLNPINAYRYLRSYLDDKRRAREQVRQQQLDEPGL